MIESEKINYICIDCINKKLDYIHADDYIRCERCGKLLEDKNSTCACKYEEIYFDECKSMLYYKDITVNLIHKMKFGHRYLISQDFGVILSFYYKDYIKKFDAITFVPLGKNRFFERGYNQSELIAKTISKILNIKNIDIILRSYYSEEKNILIKALAEIEDIYYINNEIKINIYDENSYYDNYKEKITIPFLENKNYIFDLETITQFGYFAHIGKDNFKKYGEGNFKGSILLSLSGDINIPNLYEFELSNSFNDIIRIAGNAPKDYDIKCVFTNGFLNPPMDIESLLNISLDYNDFNNLNIKIGNGGICFISENRCIIRVSLKIVQFAKNISCKKCMPCSFGFNLCEYYLNKIILGKSDNSDLIDLKNTLNMIIKGSSCLYIRNLTNCILQTIEKFNYEFLYAIEKKITLYSFINKTDII